MTDEEKVKMICEDFRMSDDGKVPVSNKWSMRWKSNGKNVEFYRQISGRQIVIQPAQIVYILQLQKWPSTNIHRKNKEILDFSYENIIWPDGRIQHNRDRERSRYYEQLESVEKYIQLKINRAKTEAKCTSSRRKVWSVSWSKEQKLIKITECEATGTSFNMGYWYLFPSIDRIDNDRGYDDENIQLVCQAYQFLKNSGTDEHAKYAIKLMYESMYGVDERQRGGGEG